MRSTKSAPSIGLVAVRLRWSLISTGVPGAQARSRPPQPLVSTTVAAAGRGGGAHAVDDRARRPRPSYRWVRPRKTSSVPVAGSAPSGPARVPGHGGGGEARAGRCVATSAVASPSASTAGSQPEPITRATSCRLDAGQLAEPVGGRRGRERAGLASLGSRSSAQRRSESAGPAGAAAQGRRRSPPVRRRPPRRRPGCRGTTPTAARPRRRRGRRPRRPARRRAVSHPDLGLAVQAHVDALPARRAGARPRR